MGRQSGKRALRKQREVEFSDTLEAPAFYGQNSHGEHSSLRPGEFRKITNYEVWREYLRNRFGSQYMRAASSPAVYPIDDDLLAGVVWDVGTEEYLITQANQSLYYQKITPGVEDPVLIQDFADTAFTLGDSTPAEMVLDGDRLYVFNPLGNAVVEWDSDNSKFKARDMGMSKPVISNINIIAGQLNGKYTVGVEKVYQVDGADFLVSSPNRRLSSSHPNSGGEINSTGTFANGRIETKISGAEATALDDDPLWTHIRLWRSKNENHDLTDPAQPIDAVGLPGELYEVALITRAEMEAVAVAPIANQSTDATLPSGNKDVRAGKPGGVYTIEDNVEDVNLVEVIFEQDIELIPLPGCRVGTVHAGRIWCSDIGVSEFDDGVPVDDQSRNQVYYSSNLQDKYHEVFSPLQRINGIKKDGQKTTKLISFEKDLVVLRESKTMRLPDGNVDLVAEEIDSAIGVATKHLAAFIPQLGIVARVNDFNDFRILGYDFVWRTTMGGMEVSLPIRKEFQALAENQNTSFVYANGKLFVSVGSGTFYVLHVTAGTGWATYEYKLAGVAQVVTTFAGGTRIIVASRGEHAAEIDVRDLNTDVDFSTGTEGNAIDLEYTTWKFQHNDGSSVLEQEWLSIMATLSDAINVEPYSNDLAWPAITVATKTPMVIGAALMPEQGLKDREYRLFLEPQTIGTFLWNRMIGNYLHYKVFTKSPATIKKHRLRAIIDTDGLGFGGFDPFQNIDDDGTPDWGYFVYDEQPNDPIITLDEVDETETVDEDF